MVFEPRNSVDINDACRRRETQLDKRNETLSSSEDLRFVTVRLQGGKGFVKRTWGLVVETRRVHPDPPSPEQSTEKLYESLTRP